MVADGGTSKNGTQYHYYTCKQRRKGKCDKTRENKDALEAYVVSCVVDFLKDKKNAELAVTDVLKYFDKKTGNESIKSIQAKIASINKEAEELADAFVKAKNDLLQKTIEKKMAEYEILLNDLSTQLAQLERGYKLTKKDLLDFIYNLISGNKNDKEYQRKIIDYLVYKVYISDDYTLVYFNIRGGKNMESVNFEDTKSEINRLNDEKNAKNSNDSVQTQSSPSRHLEERTNPFLFFLRRARDYRNNVTRFRLWRKIANNAPRCTPPSLSATTSKLDFLCK